MISQEARRLKTEQYENEAAAKKRKVAELQDKLNKDGEKLSPEEHENLSLDLDIAKQELEFYIWERDITGAKKGQRFGVELEMLLNEMGFNRNETGKPVIEDPELLQRHHLILVNMSELDRLNSSGEHKLGDVGLGLVYDTIQQELVKNLGQYLQGENIEERIPQMFEVYRMGSNDFAVVLKDVNESVAKKINDNLNVFMEMPKDSNVEGVPLASNTITFENSFELLTELSSIEKSDTNEVDKEDKINDDKNLLITLLRERMFTLGEFVKIRTRLDRMVDKIKNPEGVQSEELYEKYLKKSLGVLFVKTGQAEDLSYTDFVQALQENGADILDGEGDPLHWDAIKFKVSRDGAMRIFQDNHAMSLKMEVDLHQQIINELHKRASNEGLFSENGVFEPSLGKSAKIELDQEQLNKIDEFKKRLNGLGKTRGELLAEELEAKLESAKEAEKSDPDHKFFHKQTELAELHLEVAKLKQDTLTGLKNRGMLFKEMNERLNKQEPLSVVSIDMAFLKYFDREGGKETGDSAIKAAGRILDKIARKYEELGTQAYRVGGDEFVVTVNSDDENKVQQIINDIRVSALEDGGGIPPHPGAGARYKDEVLQFNFGLSSYGKNSDPKMADADKLVNTADALVEGDKTVNRFVLLFNREIMKKSEGADQGADLEVLYSYSAKSIFGLQGRRLIEELADEYKSKNVSLAEINRQMMEFIEMKLKDKGKDKLEKQELEHILLRNDLVKEMQEMEIARLLQDLRKAESESDSKEHVILSLKQRLRDAEQDRDKILKVRKKLA